MGTNYYVKTEACNHCGHKPKRLHIGKSSAGWTFSFHATEDIRSFASWKEYLKDKTIIDEYDREVSLEEFIELVESKKDEKYNHTIWARDNAPFLYDYHCFLDPEGHSFSEYQFS